MAGDNVITFFAASEDDPYPFFLARAVAAFTWLERDLEGTLTRWVFEE